MPTIVKEIPSNKPPVVSKYEYLFDGKIRLFSHKEMPKKRLQTVSVMAYLLGRKKGQKIHFTTRPEGVYVHAEKPRPKLGRPRVVRKIGDDNGI